MKCGNGIPAPARISYIWRVWMATKSLLPPERARNIPSETRASRIGNCSHERFPSSTDRINSQGFMALVSPRAILKLRRSEEHTSELQSRGHLVCRLLLEKKN